MDRILTNKDSFGFELGIVIIKEGDTFIGYIPALDLSTHGDSEADAVKASEEVANIFIDEIRQMGTLEEVLLELGWQKEHKMEMDHTLVPPEVIHAAHSIKVSCHA